MELIVVVLVVAAVLVGAALLPHGRDHRQLAVDVAPDTPAAFGYRTSWIAIRTRETGQVVEALDLAGVEAANWKAGIGAVYDEKLGDRTVFISPPVAGWTFVVGLALPHPMGRRFTDRCTPLLMDLGRRFSEVQYYFTYPVIDFYAWARVIDGKLTRAFAWGDDGIIWNTGRVTKEERALGLRLLEAAGSAGAVFESFPTEDHVVDLAARWGLDPTTLDRIEIAPDKGFLGRAPALWRMTTPELAAASCSASARSASAGSGEPESGVDSPGAPSLLETNGASRGRPHLRPVN